MEAGLLLGCKRGKKMAFELVMEGATEIYLGLKSWNTAQEEAVLIVLK